MDCDRYVLSLLRNPDWWVSSALIESELLHDPVVRVIGPEWEYGFCLGAHRDRWTAAPAGVSVRPILSEAFEGGTGVFEKAEHVIEGAVLNNQDDHVINC